MKTKVFRQFCSVLLLCGFAGGLGFHIFAQGLPPLPPSAPAQLLSTPAEPKLLILIEPKHPVAIAAPSLVVPDRPGLRPTPVLPRVAPVPTPVRPPVVTPSVNAQPMTALAWDAESKEVQVKEGETEAHFTFNLTNISTEEVLVNSVATSCGCTAAKLPEQPWKVLPGEGGPIQVTMDMRGKSGTITKVVTVSTSAGSKTLFVKSIAPTPTHPESAGNMNRLRNMQVSLGDRQAVFRGDCANCHVKPGEGKQGKELYVASCGICHDSPNRASAVPDLHALQFPTDDDYWRTWITVGRPDSMMPAFGEEHGGPLAADQIHSLVEYLIQAIPSKVASLE